MVFIANLIKISDTGNPVPDIWLNNLVRVVKVLKIVVISTPRGSGVFFHFGSNELVAFAVDIDDLDGGVILEVIGRASCRERV